MVRQPDVIYPLIYYESLHLASERILPLSREEQRNPGTIFVFLCLTHRRTALIWSVAAPNEHMHPLAHGQRPAHDVGLVSRDRESAHGLWTAQQWYHRTRISL
jgi:hypothetical protein